MKHTFMTGESELILPTLETDLVDLVFTSPPYENQRTYESGMPGGKKFTRRGQDWVNWLAPIIVECARVSRGLVLVNMSSPVVARKYSAAVEWLVADLTRVFGLVCGPSPYAWVKSANYEEADGNGIPGSGGADYQRRDFELIYAFADPKKLPVHWSDNTAFGHPPKFGPGGEFSNRTGSGRRANMTLMRDDGSREGHEYIPPTHVNAGNIIRCPVGGGKMGSNCASQGEAPMPVGVAERFICWFVPPEGGVLDPFSGTGTTLHAAKLHGRSGIGIDVREKQNEVARRRLETVTPPLPLCT